MNERLAELQIAHGIMITVDGTVQNKISLRTALYQNPDLDLSPNSSFQGDRFARRRRRPRQTHRIIYGIDRVSYAEHYTY